MNVGPVDNSVAENLILVTDLINKSPENPLNYAIRCGLHLKLDSIEEAEKDCDMAVDKDKQKPGKATALAYSRMGQYLASNSSVYTRVLAAELLNKALELAPNNLSKYEVENIKKALVATAGVVAKVVPPSTISHMAAGLGRAVSMKSMASSGSALNDNNTFSEEISQSMEASRERHGGDKKAYLQELLQKYADNPKNCTDYYYRAQAFIAQALELEKQGSLDDAKGYYDKALCDFKHVIQENEKNMLLVNPEFWFMCSSVKYKLEDYENALIDITIAIGFEPNNEKYLGFKDGINLEMKSKKAEMADDLEKPD